MNYPLVAVCAGSGYGKTHTVYSFLRNYDAHTIWIQISERDNTPGRFWDSYKHMISLSWPNIEKYLMEIGFPDTKEKLAKFEAIMRKATTTTEKHIMVYDDFHLMHNTTVLRFVEKSVNYLPPNTTVIFISRTAPEINITGLMLRERIFAIHEEDLCFNETEISEYFKQLELPVTNQDIRDIYDDTQGWAFAINLIGRSLRQNTRYKRRALDVMKSNIFKLIETEIFQTISEPLRRFLLRISLVDYLSTDLIKSLAKDDSLVKEMELLNAYIRYDFYQDAYIIHHLFLEYLQQNQNLLTYEERRETYQIAALWCEHNNYQADALSYYEKAKDYDAIMRIAHSFNAEMSHDIAKYMLDIFDRIPKEAVLQNPLFSAMDLKLKVNLGLTDETIEAAEYYIKYYKAQPESSEKNHALAGIYSALGFFRLLICPITNIYDFDIYFEKLGMYYDKSPFAALDTLTSQPISAWALLVGSHRAGAFEEYIDAISRSIPHISRVLNGNLYGFDDLVRGELCYFRQELGEAERHLKQALYKANERKQYDIQNRSLLYLMHIAFAHGDYNAANQLLQSMKELLNETGYTVRYEMTYDIACGSYHLMLNQPEHIPGWLKDDFSAYTHPAFLENYANLVKAQYHYQTRRYNTLLAYIENERERQVLLLCKIELKVLEALSLYQLKQRSKALVALREAYTFAELNRIAAPFIRYGKDMRTITTAALKSNECFIPKTWLENMNRKASAFAKRQAYVISKYRAINNLRDEVPLTKREIEVLRDLSQGLSRTEIAVSQDTSVNTIKMIINAIYDKLCVSTLPDAIRIATDRKVL